MLTMPAENAVVDDREVADALARRLRHQVLDRVVAAAAVDGAGHQVCDLSVESDLPEPPSASPVVCASRRDSDRALFVGRQGRLKRRQIQNPFRRYATQAALPPNRRHVHALRHSVAVHVLDAGEDIDFARDHLGHRSIQSTMTYAQLSDVRRHRTMRRLERSRDFPLPS